MRLKQLRRLRDLVSFRSIRTLAFREILSCLKELRWVYMRYCFRGGFDSLSASWFVFEERFDEECALGCEDVGKMPSLRVGFIPD